MTEEQQFDEQQSTKIVWWIIGLFTTILIAGGVGWMNHVAAQVDDLRLETKLDMVIESTRNTNTEIKELREDIRRVLEKK